ncbi:hypothetical protein DPMN_014221 [Dreissena polymorpha]|uniref:Uncharacterized protein n=1 Tax=Dreissena polymorpha TaxID=45954 RepID=A0A9D4NAH2_DREPO|nr:hypothetical protein DPMN_014221 [Dreissena polymorpha]
MSSTSVLAFFLCALICACVAMPHEVHEGFNASHAVARGLVRTPSDYYCRTHCAELCGYRAGWCCGIDDCNYGSGRCACYNYCYCENVSSD